MSVIKSFSVGDGDMFYINHNSDNFTTIDCCYSDDDNKETNFEEMKQLHVLYQRTQMKIILKELKLFQKKLE